MSVSGRIKPALPALAIFAASLSIFSPNTTATAQETCLAAPGGAAPAGQHWKYRLERGTQRKCWRLVRKDGGGEAAAKTAPQGDTDDEAQATPAPAASKPAVAPAAEAEIKPAPEPVIRTLVTRKVSNPSEIAQAQTQAQTQSQPLLSADPSASTLPRAEAPTAPTPPQQSVTNDPPPAVTTAQPVAQPVPVPQPVVAAADSAAPAAEASGGPTLGMLLLAIALLVFLACAGYLVMEAIRRRTDVLNTAHDAERLPFETSPDMSPGADAPSFAPLPPMAVVSRQDDVDHALEQFARRRRRAS